MSIHQGIGTCGSIKEQVYWEKLNQLQSQLDSVVKCVHPEYLQGIAQIEEELEQRLLYNDLCYSLHKKRIETELNSQKAVALREFEEKKSDVKETLLVELEEKKRQIEQEYLAVDLTGGYSHGTEPKQPLKRNLRRRFNEPAPFNDKKPRKASPTINFLLLENEIEDDLRKIYSATGSNSVVVVGHDKPSSNHSNGSDTSSTSTGSVSTAIVTSSSRDHVETGIEMEQILPQNGKLLYQKKWYLRGQPVTLETPEIGKVSAIIQSIGHREIGFRIVGENKRISVPLSQLQQGKCTLKKRSS